MHKLTGDAFRHLFCQGMHFATSSVHAVLCQFGYHDASSVQEGHMLPDDQLEAVREAAVAIRLDRRTPLAAIDPHLVAKLEEVSSPAAQVWTDLCRLRDFGMLTNGTIPLRTWLTTAKRLTEPLPEAKIFQDALSALDDSWRHALLDQLRKPPLSTTDTHPWMNQIRAYVEETTRKSRRAALGIGIALAPFLFLTGAVADRFLFLPAQGIAPPSASSTVVEAPIVRPALLLCGDSEHVSVDHCCKDGEEWVPARSRCVNLGDGWGAASGGAASANSIAAAAPGGAGVGKVGRRSQKDGRVGHEDASNPGVAVDATVPASSAEPVVDVKTAAQAPEASKNGHTADPAPMHKGQDLCRTGYCPQ